jgi:peptidoglycan LD-endopeptidase CwlK
MRGLELLHPEVRKQAEALVAEAAKEGLPVKISETWRTVAEQDEIYASGRTKEGRILTNAKGADYQSGHQFGVAFDVFRGERGREFDDDDGFFAKVGAIGKRLSPPLTWGGDFRLIKDKCHFESAAFMPDSSTSELKKKYKTPEEFKKTWTA